MTTGQALIVSAGAAAAGLALGSAGVRFDGALDAHMGAHAIPIAVRGLDLVVAWPLVALVFWLGALVLGTGARAIDFVAAVGAARVPPVLRAALLLVLPGVHGRSDAARYARTHPAQTALMAITALSFLSWHVVLLYNGVRTASGLSGKKLGVTFPLLLVAAEALSKLVLHLAR
jgi:hypothetical protein